MGFGHSLSPRVDAAGIRRHHAANDMACFFSLRRRHRTAISPFALLAATVTALTVTSVMAKPIAPVPPGAVELETNRFRSPLSYRATLQWFEKHLSRQGKPLHFETLVDLPDVVAAHAAAIRENEAWSGLNVSEFDGNVLFFFIAR